MPEMRRVTPITRKVNGIIVLSLVVGIGVVIGYLSNKLNQDLFLTTRTSLETQARFLYLGIKSAMLPGNAPDAVQLLKDVRNENPAYEVSLFRANGVEAFSDNSTIATVNKNLGRARFADKTALPEVPMRVGPEDTLFASSITQARRTVSSDIMRERSTLTVYSPLLNLPKCTRCHGSDHTVRGVIRIRYDITPLVTQQRTNLLVSSAIFVGAVVLLTLLLTAYLHRSVINPVKLIGDACLTVTRGKFDVRVAVRSNDEIGVLGDTVNEMVQGLYERFELSKFVSLTTLQSIKNRERGARLRLTLLFSDVRGFTAYSEQRPPEEVVGSLNRVLNVQTDIIHKCNGDVDKYVGDEVVAVFTGAEQAFQACYAALEIQREMQQAGGSVYGGLSVGIGINTGEVILGMIGSEKRADFTVIGDHVNFAARLCSAAQPAQVIVSAATYEAAAGKVRAKGPYRLRVKGKQEPQRVYLLEGEGVRA
jgi:adenylate cyclase